MSSVLDASAVLAFLQAEAGADVVEQHLLADSCCGAANWSEVAQKVRAAGRDWDLSRALLLGYGLRVEAVLQPDAEWAGARWREGEGLSLADRLCLALGTRVRGPVVTADSAWGTGPGIIQIR